MVNKVVITRVALLARDIKVYFGRTAQIGAIKKFIVKFANRIFYEGERHCANAKTRAIKVAIREIVPALIVELQKVLSLPDRIQLLLQI